MTAGGLSSIDDPEDATMASIRLPPARMTLRGRLGQKLRVTNVETGDGRSETASGLGGQDQAGGHANGQADDNNQPRMAAS